MVVKKNLLQFLLEQNNFNKNDWLEMLELSNEQILAKMDLLYYSKLTEGLKIFLKVVNCRIYQKQLMK